MMAGKAGTSRALCCTNGRRNVAHDSSRATQMFLQDVLVPVFERLFDLLAELVGKRAIDQAMIER